MLTDVAGPVRHKLTESELSDTELSGFELFDPELSDFVLPAALAVPLPAHIGFAEGACLGIPAMTAYHAVAAQGDMLLYRREDEGGAVVVADGLLLLAVVEAVVEEAGCGVDSSFGGRFGSKSAFRSEGKAIWRRQH